MIARTSVQCAPVAAGPVTSVNSRVSPITFHCWAGSFHWPTFSVHHARPPVRPCPPLSGHLIGKNVHYGKDRREFTPEYTDEAVKLVFTTGRAVANMARELGINEASLGGWVTAFKTRNDTGEKVRDVLHVTGRP